jgi:peptide-methionine (S)-S-oxide reductase
MNFCKYTLTLFIFLGITIACKNSHSSVAANLEVTPPYQPGPHIQKAYFASGCFWCVEAIFESVHGVEEVISGYSGGEAKDANYDAVSAGYTKHAESVEVYYDPKVIDYKTLVKVFFGSHNATTLNRQGPDFGKQYRSIVFYQTEEEHQIVTDFIERMYLDGGLPQGTITTEVVPFKAFFPAEPYHQNYEKLHPDDDYIRGVSLPRLHSFKSNYPELLKKS